MGFRYCPECDEWLETAEYTVDESGQVICPDHKAVHGFIIDAPWSTTLFYSEHPSWYEDRQEMFEAAKRQRLVE